MRFLTRAGVLNTHPGLAAVRTLYRIDESLDAIALAEEALSASGALERQHVSAAEATQLGPGEFFYKGEGGCVHIGTNKTGLKGVSPHSSGFQAFLLATVPASTWAHSPPPRKPPWRTTKVRRVRHDNGDVNVADAASDCGASLCVQRCCA